jgi:serine/threonine-protein kinase
MAQIEVGQVIARKYRVERVLGQGGMGIVLAAHHVHLDQRVAIKTLLPEVAIRTEAVARFAREARAAVKIQSEHVARVLDVSELDDGTPFMVIEYLEGTDLSDLFARARRMQPAEVIGYVLQACEALAEAHKLGIVHRDLKPANLFVTRRADGTDLVKVLDFGISKAPESAGSHALTATASFLGSPQYVPPEQLLSTRDVDARADIWAIGVILYEGLAGAPPFVAASLMELASRILQTAPEPLASLRPDIPRALADAIMTCLEKEPSKRFANVSELAAALSPFAAEASRASVERISRIVGDSQSRRADRPSDPKGGATLVSSGARVQGPARTANAWTEGSESVQLPMTSPSLARGAVAAVILIFACVAVYAIRRPSESVPPPVGAVQSVATVAAEAPSATPVVSARAPEPAAPAASGGPTAAASEVAGGAPAASASVKPSAPARPITAEPARPRPVQTDDPRSPQPAPQAPPPAPNTAEANPLRVRVK